MCQHGRQCSSAKTAPFDIAPLVKVFFAALSVTRESCLDAYLSQTMLRRHPPNGPRQAAALGDLGRVLILSRLDAKPEASNKFQGLGRWDGAREGYFVVSIRQPLRQPSWKQLGNDFLYVRGTVSLNMALGTRFGSFTKVSLVELELFCT